MERRKDAPISYKCSLSSSLVRQLVSRVREVVQCRVRVVANEGAAPLCCARLPRPQRTVHLPQLPPLLPPTETSQITTRRTTHRPATVPAIRNIASFSDSGLRRRRMTRR
jgi:hypothetical protein